MEIVKEESVIEMESKNVREYMRECTNEMKEKSENESVAQNVLCIRLLSAREENSVCASV